MHHKEAQHCNKVEGEGGGSLGVGHCCEGIASSMESGLNKIVPLSVKLLCSCANVFLFLYWWELH